MLQKDLNALVLAGKDPRSAASELIDHNRTDKMAQRAMGNPGIVARNRMNFEAIQAEELAPYRTLYQAMMTASVKSPVKVEYEEVICDRDGQPVLWTKDGKQVPRTVKKWREDYVDAPNWPVRIQAAKNILSLTGQDPRYELRVNVGSGASGTGVTVSFGDAVLSIGEVSGSYDDKVAEYGKMKQAVQRGEIDAVIEADFEATPIGVQPSEYDKLPPEKF